MSEESAARTLYRTAAFFGAAAAVAAGAAVVISIEPYFTASLPALVVAILLDGVLVRRWWLEDGVRFLNTIWKTNRYVLSFLLLGLVGLFIAYLLRRDGIVSILIISSLAVAVLNIIAVLHYHVGVNIVGG